MAGRALFVASTGGHLEQLYRLHSSLLAPGDVPVWVTFDSPQSRSLLHDQPEVHFIPRIGSRGWAALACALWPAWRILMRTRPTTVFSTGAAIALAFLPMARLVGARATYIESAARTTGPSITGRLLRVAPWVRLRTQYETWARGRWQYGGSVFDCFTKVDADRGAAPIRRVVVTVGTQEGFPFVSLIERMQRIVPDDVEVLWQIGEGFSESQRPAGASEFVPRAELAQWIATADVVVAHAGVGSALTLLEAGHVPVLVPRRASHGEHIDDHQQLIAQELSVRGLAVSRSPDTLTWADLVQASMSAVADTTAVDVPNRPAAAAPDTASAA